jgi:hypothetical protein
MIGPDDAVNPDDTAGTDDRPTLTAGPDEGSGSGSDLDSIAPVHVLWEGASR